MLLYNVCVAKYGISIHALREEGDLDWWSLSPAPSDFNPRPPRGGRPGLVELEPGPV